MKEQVKVRNTKKNIIVILALLLLGVIAFYFVIYRPIIKYEDTHTWATIRVTGAVETEASDVLEESREFLQGDTYQLRSATVSIKDITTAGEVTIKFEPEVNNLDTGELIAEAVIGKHDVLNVQEICDNGDCAIWQIRVISNRYQ